MSIKTITLRVPKQSISFYLIKIFSVARIQRKLLKYLILDKKESLNRKI